MSTNKPVKENLKTFVTPVRLFNAMVARYKETSITAEPVNEYTHVDISILLLTVVTL